MTVIENKVTAVNEEVIEVHERLDEESFSTVLRLYDGTFKDLVER